jgi:hypothetical protein
MVLAIYKKNRAKDKWTLSSVAMDMYTATEYSKKMIAKARKFGYDEVSSTIQSFDSVWDVPKFLEKIKPEKLLYS